MKSNRPNRIVFAFWLFLLSLCLIAQPVTGQNLDAEPAPQDERFEPALDLITVTRWFEIDNVTRLYNSDGSLWAEYNLRESSPLYIKKQPEIKLDLIFPNRQDYFKMKAVSRNWYEVEIDSDGKTTKFARIDDRFLTRGGIKTMILVSPKIDFDPVSNPLLESPDGARLPDGEAKNVLYKAVGFDGEWVQVEIVRSEQREEIGRIAWIRWMKDNNLLIRFYYR